MKIGELAKHFEISPQTLRCWEKAGLITSKRTPLGHRVFTPENILEIQKLIKARSLERRKAESRL
jgi:DNA-binding transcriptional MerR regulator